MKSSSILFIGLATVSVGAWVTVASMNFSAKTLASTAIYQDTTSQNIIVKVPPSTRLDIVHCFDTGSDFYYAVQSETGVEGYVYELRMKYQRSWHMPSFRKLFSNPMPNVSCLTMTNNWNTG